MRNIFSQDIIIEKSGGSDKQPVGRVIFFEGPNNTYLFNNFTGLLRVKNQEKWFTKYVFYSLYANYQKGGTRRFENKTTGLHNLKTDDYINTFDVADKELTEQIQICEILDKIRALISMRKNQLHELDDLIKSQFIEMFGDPKTNPKKWQEGTVRDIVTEVKYGTSKPAIEGGKYKYIRMNNITYNGELDLTDLKYIDIPEKEVEKCIVRIGDVLFNRTNSKELVGKTCVFNQEEDMVIAGYIIRVRMNDKALPEYLSAVLNSKYGKETLYGMCKAIVGQANINAQELQDIKVVIPPIELQQDFVKLKEQVNKLKVEAQKSLDEMEVMFDAMMQKYFG